MTIQEEENSEEPALKHRRFVVDRSIKHGVKAFPEQASYIVFCGASRSGQWSLMTSLLMNYSICKRAYSNMLLCMPEHALTYESQSFYRT